MTSDVNKLFVEPCTACGMPKVGIQTDCGHCLKDQRLIESEDLSIKLFAEMVKLREENKNLKFQAQIHEITKFGKQLSA